MNYFIKIDGEEKGPLGAAQIRERLLEKGLTGDDLVRRENSAAWVTLRAMGEFRKASQPLVPHGNPLAYVSLSAGCAVALMIVLLIFIPDRIHPGPWVGLVYFGLGFAAIICGHLAVSRVNPYHALGGRWTSRAGLWLGYIILLLPVVLTILNPFPHHIQEKGNITKGMSNCRQIIMTLKLYASDHQGKYPDAAVPAEHSANAVFRQLFVSGEADNEMIFFCPASMDGTPDGNIGTAPDFREAVQPDENHWAMTKGLTDKSDGKIPLVYENPQDATWPPKWAPDFMGRGKPGRTWSGGRVIVGLNDGSVSLMPLESAEGEHVGLKPDADGKSVFPDLNPKPEVLRVETKYR